MTTKWDWIELNSGIGGSTVYGSSIETKLNETEQNNLVSPFDSARRFRAHYSWKHFPIWKVFLIRMDHPAFWRSAWLATSWRNCSGYWLNFSTDSHGKRIQQKFPSGASRGTLLKGARVSTKSRLGILRTKTLATRNFRVKTCDDNTNQFSGQNVRWQNKIMHLLESRCAVSGSGQNQPMLALCCWSWHVLVRQKERAPTRLVHEGRDAATRFTSDTRDTSVVTDKMAPPRAHLTTINGGRRDVLSTDNQDRNGWGITLNPHPHSATQSQLMRIWDIIVSQVLCIYIDVHT